MKFKNDRCELEFKRAPERLKEIANRFDVLTQELDKEAIITRVLEPITGDSGVHEAHRAVDYRDQFGKKFTFTPNEVTFLVTTINHEYPRLDGKQVCIHHSFKGAPQHFHLQIPYGWLDKDEIERIEKGE